MADVPEGGGSGTLWEREFAKSGIRGARSLTPPFGMSCGVQSDTLNRLCEPNERKDVHGPAVSGTPCGTIQRRRGCLGHFWEGGNRCSGSRDKRSVRPSPSKEPTSTRGIRRYPNPMTYHS